jgi:hypothetical protein
MLFSITALIATGALNETAPIGEAGEAGEAGVPDKTKTYIDSITYGGSGCCQGTVSLSISQDLTTFTLIFDEFIAETGPTKSIRDSRKNCQVNIDLRYPQGWSYSIVSVDYRGFVNVPRGVTATQTSTYYFSGEIAQIQASLIFRGSVENDYLISDKIATSEIVWSPCGKVSQYNALWVAIQVSNSNDNKYIY